MQRDMVRENIRRQSQSDAATQHDTARLLRFFSPVTRLSGRPAKTATAHAPLDRHWNGAQLGRRHLINGFVFMGPYHESRSVNAAFVKPGVRSFPVMVCTCVASAPESSSSPWDTVRNETHEGEHEVDVVLRSGAAGCQHEYFDHPHLDASKGCNHC